jgi:hypothetical protein
MPLLGGLDVAAMAMPTLPAISTLADNANRPSRRPDVRNRRIRAPSLGPFR